MGLTINDDSITGDRTSHTARPAPGRPGTWEVSWLPGRLLGRNEAITAMILADTISTEDEDLHERRRLWPHIQGWAAELGLTAHDAVAGAAQPTPAGPGRQDPEPEAAGW
jgi:hypothetical protein